MAIYHSRTFNEFEAIWVHGCRCLSRGLSPLGRTNCNPETVQPYWLGKYPFKLLNGTVLGLLHLLRNIRIRSLDSVFLKFLGLGHLQRGLASLSNDLQQCDYWCVPRLHETTDERWVIDRKRDDGRHRKEHDSLSTRMWCSSQVSHTAPIYGDTPIQNNCDYQNHSQLWTKQPKALGRRGYYGDKLKFNSRAIAYARASTLNDIRKPFGSHFLWLCLSPFVTESRWPWVVNWNSKTRVHIVILHLIMRIK